MADRYAARTDPALWVVRRSFGVAGGPDEVALSDEGRARAFSVGAQVRRGGPAEALEELYMTGGVGALIEWTGNHGKKTPLGRFDQVAWGHLRSLGYVESLPNDRVGLTDKGRRACSNGFEERGRLLVRCRLAATPPSTSGIPGERDDGEGR